MRVNSVSIKNYCGLVFFFFLDFCFLKVSRLERFEYYILFKTVIIFHLEEKKLISLLS